MQWVPTVCYKNMLKVECIHSQHNTHMSANRITAKGAGLLGDLFYLVKEKLPEGWIWDPILVSSSGLKPDSTEDFNMCFFKKNSTCLVVFCTGLRDRKLTAKIVVSYKADAKESVISSVRDARPEWNMNKPGEMRYGVKALIGITNIPTSTSSAYRSHHHKSSEPPVEKVRWRNVTDDKVEVPRALEVKLWEKPKAVAAVPVVRSRPAVQNYTPKPVPVYKAPVPVPIPVQVQAASKPRFTILKRGAGLTAAT